jgi:hypothetical protein
MKFFTGKFQGNIPILTDLENDANIIEHENSAASIATLLTAMYGIEWKLMPITGYNMETHYKIFKP